MFFSFLSLNFFFSSIGFFNFLCIDYAIEKLLSYSCSHPLIKKLLLSISKRG